MSWFLQPLLSLTSNIKNLNFSCFFFQKPKKTFIFRGIIISDPTSEEEQLAAGSITITMDKDVLAHMYKPGHSSSILTVNLHFYIIFDIFYL